MIVSLILPCYNPPPGWEKIVHENYTSFGKEVSGALELILVLDGKTPNITKENLQFLEQHISQITVVSYTENRGKGFAIRQGVAKAKGDIIIYTDVDFPYNAASMRSIYNSLVNDSCDVAIGVKDNDYYTHVPFVRRVISRFLRFVVRTFLSMPITDTQCGLKGFKSSVAPLFLQTTIDRYLFDLEFVRNCYKSKKYHVLPVPAALNENVHFRNMNFRILLPEMFNFAKLLFRKN
jgi:glycosyltransferase involved in cell wall biosynthesis